MRTLLPRIDHGHARLVEIAQVSCGNGHVVMEGCSCDEKIRLRKRVSRLAAIFNKHPPPQEDIFGDRKNALIECGPDGQRQPVVQAGAADYISNGLNSKTDFGHRDNADIQVLNGMAGKKRGDLRIGSRAAQLRKNVRIEKVTHSLEFNIAYRHGKTPGLKVDFFVGRGLHGFDNRRARSLLSFF